MRKGGDANGRKQRVSLVMIVEGLVSVAAVTAAVYFAFRAGSSKQPVTPGHEGLGVRTLASAARNDALATPSAAWIAIATFVARAREIGVDPAHAGDLLTRATSWWGGDAAAWKAFIHQEHLPILQDLPESDDDLVVIVYRVEGTNDAPMRNRFEATALLRVAQAGQTIFRSGFYYVPTTTKLTSCGFHR